MDEMKRLLIIGGTGFLGYHIIKEAKKRNFKITSISLRNPKLKRFHRGITYIKADISNFEILRKKIIKKFDYVINAGGYGLHPDFGKKGNTLIKNHFGTSLNHFIYYVLVSLLGFFLYIKNENFKKLVYGLFFLSIILELLHFIIPNRSFELHDLWANIFGVVVAYFVIKIYLLFNKL